MNFIAVCLESNGRKSWRHIEMLISQCKKLGIPIETLALSRQRIENEFSRYAIHTVPDVGKKTINGWVFDKYVYVDPADAALAYYKSKGGKGFYDEGYTLLWLIRVICFDIFKELTRERVGLWRTNAPNDFLHIRDRIDDFCHNIAVDSSFYEFCKKYPHNIDLFIGTVRQATPELIVANYQKRWFSDVHGENKRFPNPLNGEVLLEIWNCIEPDKWAQLTKAVATLQYKKGWPDLIIAQNNLLHFIELKTKDILLPSQEKLIYELLLPIGFSVSVLQVVPQK